MSSGPSKNSDLIVADDACRVVALGAKTGEEADLFVFHKHSVCLVTSAATFNQASKAKQDGSVQNGSFTKRDNA